MDDSRISLASETGSVGLLSSFWQNLRQPSLLIPRSSEHSAIEFDSGSYSVGWPAKLSRRIQAWAESEGLTASVFLEAIWALLLYRYSQEAARFGVWQVQQGGIRVREIQCLPDLAFRAWLSQFQAPDSAISLEQVQSLALTPDSPLFESLLVFPAEQAANLQAPLAKGLAALTVWIETSEGWKWTLNYDPARCDAATAERLVQQVQILCEGVLDQPNAHLAELPLLTPAEHQLLAKWNETAVDYPHQGIHQLFEMQVARTPDQVAVILPNLAGGAETLTYRALDDRASRLAIQLRHRGVAQETRVALLSERSLEMMVAILAILKAGGCYLPLDPAYPVERLAFMLEDAQAAVLLIQPHLHHRLPRHSAQVIELDLASLDAEGEATPCPQLLAPQPAPQKFDAQQLAYINYTSGSTGRPKGVAVPHRAIARLVFGAAYTPLDGSQTFLQLAPIAFDAATLEIWGALLHGGRCVLFPGSGIPDPQLLKQVISQHQVTSLWLTAALFNALVSETPEALAGVTEILTGGEALSATHIRLAQARLPETQLVNGYGPTEGTTFTCCYRIPPLPAEATSIPIGRPIGNTQVYILDERRQLLPIGAIGELYIGGDGLAREYLNRPDLTQRYFIAHPFRDDPTARLYKTGDLARYLPDGNLEFVGRRDGQVKLRGYRIELSEIEAVLQQHPTVREAVVILRGEGDRQQLVGYVTPAAEHPSVSQLKAYLRQRLADYMLPAALLVIAKIPLTPNGKVDRRALPQPPAAAAHFVAPQSPTERQLADIWSNLLGLDPVGIENNFFDLGGSSILGMQLIARVQSQFNSSLRPVQLYQFPTIRTMARWLDQEARQSHLPNQSPAAVSAPSDGSSPSGDIAIVGMVGRFPGANSIEALWQNLSAGVESITVFTQAELDPSEPEDLRHDPHYVPAKGVLQGAEEFDAAFFGITPREAEVMDPQMRVFLELAHEALEATGYLPENYGGRIGLYAGSGQNTYFERHLCGRPEIISRIGDFQTMLANQKDFLTSRTSYKLNLTGPSVSVNTACSTSLVAIIQAVQSLRTEDCDLALAGGISIGTPQNTGYLHQEGGMLSPDGHCRPFDAKAQGTLFNNGAALVVLKRAETALRDGDRVYALIKGVGLNNDGSDKVSFTAPSVNGQRAAILRAQADAKVSADSISYIEAHGTATQLGDPIELAALTQAFQTPTTARQFCAIGSIKGNLGHLVAAAGAAGLIKTALALYHKQLPPSLNFESANPELALESSPFYVNTQLADWQSQPGQPRRAGVSSFGVGGTNAHVVLEAAPPPAPAAPSRPCQVLLLSARTATALDRITGNLKTHLEAQPDLNLADVAHLLQTGRRGWNHRRFVVCQDIQAAVVGLDALPPKRSATRYSDRRNPELVMMFPGQGSQYLGMGEAIYRQEPVFRAAVDRCAAILQPLLELDLRELLYAADTAELLRQTRYTQPALFATEYALALLWQSWGIVPTAMIGHSVGEFVAACLAGVFSLEDALTLVAKRGQMMADLPAGSMLSVRLSAVAVEPYLTPELAIAAVNGPSLCVVSGPSKPVAQLQRALEAAEIVCKPLHTSHAFHSPMMQPVVSPFAELLGHISLSPPQIPFISTVTADWITDAQAIDPLYWASHLRATVRFADGVQKLWEQPQRVLLEVGPRGTLATLARQQAQDPQQAAVASLGSAPEAEWESLMQAIGQLWLSGIGLDWASFYGNEPRQRLPLPTYPFERQRYWIDPPATAPSLASPPQTAPQTGPRTAPQTDVLQTAHSSISPSTPMAVPRQQRLIPLLKDTLQAVSGLETAAIGADVTFLEMGLDSLSLTQVALALKKQFKVKIAFRNLLEDYPNLPTLAEFLDQALPADALPAAPSQQAAVLAAEPAAALAASFASESNGNGRASGSENGYTNGDGKHNLVLGASQSAATYPAPTYAAPTAIEALMAQQLQIMNQQLELLRQAGGQPGDAPSAPPAAPPVISLAQAPEPAPLPAAPPQKSSGPGAKIERNSQPLLSAQQQTAIDRIIARYTTRTPESKRQTQAHRAYLADPRTVSGFTPLLKEMVYPIVTERSAGSKLWDVDGNEYVDLTNGFGLSFFGWNPDFVRDAVVAQLDKGIEIGPQSPLAGRVAKLITEFTGMERVAFCNTGSEAVMATLRLARTVTGRDLVATFTGDYHGTFDEVLYRPGANLKTLPAAPGILPGMFENLLVLEYGTPESLEILRARADDLAAILVEPVRSRDPNLQPKQFLQDLRQLTQQSGTAYIFDEVVTGFRVHPGGAQAHFDIQADLATYGKVVGGGIPIGIVAGKAEYMDALDGGFWQYGDDSIPEVGVTFFAGTFVRHPMALAAAEAVLLKLRAGGPELQRSLADKVQRFATHLNQHCERVGAPIKLEHFTSYFYISYPAELPYAQLLFYLLREKGVHIWDHRPCFLTLSHTDADIELVTRAFKDSVAELQAIGFLPGVAAMTASSELDRNQPPQAGARLGKDPQGNPAWYVPDPNRFGKYLQVGGVT